MKRHSISNPQPQADERKTKHPQLDKKKSNLDGSEIEARKKNRNIKSDSSI